MTAHSYQTLIHAMKHDTINRDNIKQLVERFYEQVRADEVLGPVFLRALGEDWDAHLERLSEFWSSVMLGTRSFHGNVYGTHMQLNGIEPEHFRRWLALFEETASTLYEAKQAGEFLEMARRVASSLQIGFFGKVVHAE
jgi:hemoglobin